MRRSNVFALLGGLILGIGIGVFAVLSILNSPGTPAVQAPTAAAIAPAPPSPQAATGADPKAAIPARLRTSTGAQATADTRRTAPPIQSPPYSGTAPIGSGGTIFSGADANDPRVQHF